MIAFLSLRIKEKIQFSIHDIDWLKFGFDFIFIVLSVISFYSSLLILIMTLCLFFIYFYRTNHYLKNRDGFYLDAFIDFLNQINSNLCIGMGFDSAIITASQLLAKDLSYSSQAIHKLNKTIKMGINTETLYEKICGIFPIYESSLFSRMMLLSKETGANPTEITNITIDKLYLKHKVINEIEIILYQKKLEQTILCLAPMFIILFIKASAPDYLEIMYDTLMGKFVMSFALSLIILMKIISERIINFKI